MMDKNRFTQFCLKGLERMYIPSEHVFSASRRLSDGQMVHVRDRNREYRFTMNALMGLHQAQTQGSGVFLNIESDYHDMAARIDEQSGSTEDIAATVWTGRCIGTEIPHKATLLFHNRLENAPRMKRLSAKGLAWLIAACLTSSGEEYYVNALALSALAAERYIHAETALVREVTAGLRRDWASFGAQSYMAYAFLLLARRTGSAWARSLGLRIARRLVQLQGREGQWGWMYHVPSGRVADFYPIYSVHQYAYAPFFLVEAIDQGYDEFREPLVRGFRWILGQNELGQSMVEPMHQVVWRRVIRRGPNSKLIKVLRGMVIIHCGLKSGIKGADAVQIDRQCWGFEMALPLCVFSGRGDFSEILDDNCFS
jgi:hypothetical protein